jgi:hypothetical protein
VALFTVGIVGVEFLVIPTLGGISGIRLRGKAGVVPRPGQKLKHARAFLRFICLSTAVGVGLDFVSIGSVKALNWTAVYQWIVSSIPSRSNLLIASDNKLMQSQPNCSVDSVSRLGRESVGLDCFADSLGGCGND